MSKHVLVFHWKAKWLVAQLEKSRPEYSYAAGETLEEALEKAPDAEIVAGMAPFIPPELVRAMPKLEWIHALTTGYENLLEMEALDPAVVISNSRGLHGPQMSELAILLMLALVRRFPQIVRNQARAKWELWEQPLLYKKTVCIVGVGVIGEALAARCRPFGMRITGVSDGRSEVPGFDRIYRRRAIEEAVAEADFVVVVVPHTPETHHIINSDVMRAMKPSGYLINIARGGCVDEAALVEHLQAGTFAGAGLDVFGTEPLPEDSPIWSLPNTIVTPHIGGMSDIYHEQVLPILEQHLDAYAKLGPAGLPNRVERKQQEEP